MRIIRTVAGVAEWRRRLQREGVMIGFVPTMGALHDGHRALIRSARLASDALAVSIFVNPTQFGRGEDFTRYPRQLAHDAKLCRSEGVDVLFAPSVGDMYPPEAQTIVSVPALARRWEGAHRPGHFEGVATVVTKLLGLVRPDVAVFGQKDYQQGAIVRRLVEDLNLGTRIVVHPTVREANGLALSSRNVFLSSVQRKTAAVLFRALCAGRGAIRTGARSRADVEQAMRRLVRAERSVGVDYLVVCDAETLEPARRLSGRLVLLGAIRVGKVRLIDNLLVTAGRSAHQRSV